MQYVGRTSIGTLRAPGGLRSLSGRQTKKWSYAYGLIERNEMPSIAEMCGAEEDMAHLPDLDMYIGSF